MSFSRKMNSRTGPRPIRCAWLALSAGLLPALPAQANEAVDVGFDVTLATDYLFRGVSQTMSSPTLQGGMNLSHESGLFAYAWGSNVDFIADGDADDGARLEFDAAIGYHHAVTNRLALTLTWVQYAFPGTDEDVDYNYGEFTGSLLLDERHGMTVAYAPSVFGSGTGGIYVAASSAVELPGDLTIDVLFGYYDLGDAYGESYRHGSVSLSGDFGEWRLKLACHGTDSYARTLFDEVVVRSRAVLTLSRTF